MSSWYISNATDKLFSIICWPPNEYTNSWMMMAQPNTSATIFLKTLSTMTSWNPITHKSSELMRNWVSTTGLTRLLRSADRLRIFWWYFMKSLLSISFDDLRKISKWAHRLRQKPKKNESTATWRVKISKLISKV